MRLLKYFLKKFKKKFTPQNIKKPASKVAHNPTRPLQVFGFLELRQFFSLFFFLIFVDVKLFRRNSESRDSSKEIPHSNNSPLFSLNETRKCKGISVSAILNVS